MSEVITEGTCMKCGYDLNGLPIVGRCPECGQSYDGHTRTGLGNAFAVKQARQTRLLARLRTLSLVALAVMVFACSGIIAILFSAQPVRPITVGAIFAGLIGLAALTSYMYENNEQA